MPMCCVLLTFFICVYRDHFFGRFRPVNMPIYVYIIFITQATKANPLTKFVIFSVSACQPFSISIFRVGLFFARSSRCLSHNCIALKFCAKLNSKCCYEMAVGSRSLEAITIRSNCYSLRYSAALPAISLFTCNLSATSGDESRRATGDERRAVTSGG